MNPFRKRSELLAEPINPYAAPQTAGYAPLASGSLPPYAGLWRQGNLLVMHKGAPLPAICVKSNQPATGRLKRNLSWHHPAFYLILPVNGLTYLIVALIVRKTAKIHIPLTDEWFALRQRRMIFAWSAILLSIAIFIAGIGAVVQPAGQPPDVITALALIGAPLLGLVAAIYGAVACRLVSAKRMTDHYIWLKGVHPGFLDRLEVWSWNL